MSCPLLKKVRRKEEIGSEKEVVPIPKPRGTLLVLTPDVNIEVVSTTESMNNMKRLVECIF